MALPGNIYLDSNFLVAYFANNHDDHDASKILFFNLLKENCKLYISVLGLDESWYKIYEVLQKGVPKDKRKPIQEFYNEIKQILEALKSLSQDVKIIQFEKNLDSGITNSVENIGKFNFHPRDAFHLAYMQDLDLKAIITKDKKYFSKVPGIQIICY